MNKTNYIIKSFLLICFIILNNKLLIAQYFNFTNYTVETGFPQSNANYIMQDKEGFMWFATQIGTVKFNGYTFTIYNEKNGLSSNFVNHIMQDSKGRFWFSTKNGLSKFENNKFENFSISDGLFSNTIYYTYELPDSTIFVTTTEGSHIIKNDRVIKLSKEIKPKKIITRLNGELWALTANEIYRLKNSELIPIKIDKSKIHSTFNTFAEDKHSNLWIAGENGIYKISNDKILHLTQENGLLSNNIDNLLIDSENKLWYSSELKGCGFYAQNTFHNLTVESGLSNAVVLSIFEDAEKNIWIGGRNGATMINTKIPFVHYDQISSFENEIVMGMKIDTFNNIWFTTYGFGLTKFDGKNYKNFTKENGSIDNHFFDIETDELGNFLLASGNNGIIRFNGSEFEKIKPVNYKTVSTRVLTAFKDSKKRIWFGTNGEGIFVYKNNILSHFGDGSEYKFTDIMAVNEDIYKNIWVGSLNDGLFKITDNKIENFKSEYNLNFIRSIAIRKDEVWIGTGSSGLYRIKEIDGKYSVMPFQKQNGLNSDNIYVIFNDSKNNIWCGSERGVDKLIFNDADSIIRIKNYTKDEGFIGIETNINAAVEDKNGSIWFGTVNGAVKYNASADKINYTENKTYITGIRLFFEPTDWSKFSDTIINDIPKNLILPYNQNHLSFDFIGLCFSNPQKVQYKYRLLGQSDKWSPPTLDNKAVFTNIAPGNYEFQVLSANNDDIWNNKPVSVKFKIKAPFWQNLWFILSALTLLIIFIYLIINLRVKSLRKAKENLELQVNKRTSELNLQTIILEKTNIKITDSINYAGKIQSAMFPSLQLFQSNFSEYFIIFHPKDIISGDFYWAREFSYHNDDFLAIVVADCTGHGIPGALVSMLGMSLLNEITRRSDITKPSDVLEILRKEIKESFKQTNSLNEQTEGIDMVFCSLNKKTKVLEYSGANNPIYIVRDGILIVLEPTMNPVGSYIKEISFKNHSMQLKEGDLVYIFSDGYVDQFNGKTGEKFKIKRFQKILLQNHKKSLQDQNEVLEKIYANWKAGSKQIDDILILGFKI